MNEAIKLAIEKGGYKHGSLEVVKGQLFAFGGRFHPNELENGCILDPLFWLALGKALRWPEETDICALCESVTIGSSYAGMKAHEYFDLVLANDDTEKFWGDILNQ